MVLIPEEDTPDKLSLALEPESAAIYCQSMTQQQLASYAEASLPDTSKSYLIVDIGGGTVDISAYQLTTRPEKHMEVLLPPTGNDCGGSRVNKEFAKFLETLVSDEGFSRYTSENDESANATNRAYLNELINETFESQKLIFGQKAGEGSKANIRLPFSFMEVYKSKLQQGIKRLNDERVELANMNLRVTYAKIEDFFKPIVSGLLQCMSEALENIDAPVETIYLVGGFGGCHYIHKVVKKRFGSKYNYITPAESDCAVVRGAVLFRRNPNTVVARRADATYGVDANIPFEEGKHEEDFKWFDKNQEPMCKNIFSTFVERGDILPTSEVLIQQYSPVSPDQRIVHVNIYSSSEKDVWYTTERRPKNASISTLVDVRKIGELIVPLHTVQLQHETSGQTTTDDTNERTVEVTFDFSHTEIQVKGFDCKTKTEVKVVLDFLSS